MKTAAQIISLAKEEKQKLWKYFHSYGRAGIKESKTKFKRHELNALLLLTIENPIELCRFLKKNFFDVQNKINNRVYKKFLVPKKKGGVREIYAPEKELKKLQKRLNYYLQAYYLMVKPKEVHGFTVNRGYTGNRCNIAANAQMHTGKKYVLNIDLKDFFPGIPAKRVKELFTSPLFAFNEQIATALALLTTYEGRLPAGAPTSPVISNFICIQLDEELKQFCDSNQLTYSRYADDLTFSANYQINDDVQLDIICLIHKNGFRVNEKKCRITSANRRQTVTGLTVNEKVNIDRKMLKKIRAMLHDATTNGVRAAARNHFNISGNVDEQWIDKFVYRLRGYINFIGQVRGKEDDLYRKYKQALNLHIQTKYSKS